MIDKWENVLVSCDG